MLNGQRSIVPFLVYIGPAAKKFIRFKQTLSMTDLFQSEMAVACGGRIIVNHLPSVRRFFFPDQKNNFGDCISFIPIALQRVSFS